MNDIDQIMSVSLDLTEEFMSGVTDPIVRKQCIEQITTYLLDDQICSIDISKRLFVQCQLDFPFSQSKSSEMSKAEFDLSVRSKALSYYEDIRNLLRSNFKLDRHSSSNKTLSEEEVQKAFLDAVYKKICNHHFVCHFAGNTLSLEADHHNSKIMTDYAEQFLLTQQPSQKPTEDYKHYLSTIINHAYDCRRALCDRFTQVVEISSDHNTDHASTSPKLLTMKRL